MFFSPGRRGADDLHRFLPTIEAGPEQVKPELRERSTCECRASEAKNQASEKRDGGAETRERIRMKARCPTNGNAPVRRLTQCSMRLRCALVDRWFDRLDR